jgi:hypothetical protein
MKEIDWAKPHILKIANDIDCFEQIDESNLEKLRAKIEPWLTAVFQSEHLTLLAGTGLTAAVTNIAGIRSQGMGRIEFEGEFKNIIKNKADEQATGLSRGKANSEDDIRVAIDLYKGLLIQDNPKAKELKKVIDKELLRFIKLILNTENEFVKKKSVSAMNYLKSFLISFSSRTASRDRLNIITTNYDRFIEYACDSAGIIILDSFTGKINPIMRTNKISLDYHYNPPGIRGEPRYVEGVVRYTKIHGSLDWKFESRQITKTMLPFGAEENHSSLPKEENTSDFIVIYPNSSKDIETIYFPYADLFRDFTSATCQPNSVVVTYGYGFGDSHINRILEDMLTIPSTHLVIISYDSASGRIKNFVERNNLSQFTILIGGHFGDLRALVDSYLPKAAIDRISNREDDILNRRAKKDNEKTDKSEPVK